MTAVKTPATPNAAGYQRPLLSRAAPLRGAGQLYRGAEGPGTALGGVPLSSAEDAVVAAVRMGYRVAQAQVDRAGRIGKRLRHAGERAVGAEPERQAVDATEQLVSSALLTMLEWFEGVAAEPGSPLRRYAAVQYKLLGAMLGLQVDAAAGATAASAASAAAAATPAPAASTPVRAAQRDAGRRGATVRHRGGARRAVRVLQLRLDHPAAEGNFALLFYDAQQVTSAPIEADLTLVIEQPALLHISTAADSPAGIWKAAVCAPDGEQLGWIEIEL